MFNDPAPLFATLHDHLLNFGMLPVDDVFMRAGSEKARHLRQHLRTPCAFIGGISGLIRQHGGLAGITLDCGFAEEHFVIGAGFAII